MSELFIYLKKRLAVIVLVSMLTASSLWVAHNTFFRHRSEEGTSIVIRIAHKVTDKNVQRAFRVIADEYEKFNPGVKVEPILIAEKAYQQWITTQCIGKTVPDIVQMGGYYTQTWQSLASRYMIPLSSHVNRPNPYNKNTDLEGLQWRQTYLDNMKSGYWDHLTEYYTIPLTVETIRIYYNKTLMKEITGSDQPPENYTDFIGVCEQIKEYAQAEEKKLFPFAVDDTTIYTILYRYYGSLTEGMVDKYDPCYWASPRVECTLYGLYTDTFTFKHRQIKAAFEIVKNILNYSQPGFTSSDSSQARFLFIQENSAMIVGNVRDAKVYADSADFEIGVFDFPLPRKDHPVYGDFVETQMSESQVPTIHFSITQNCPHPEQAIDFMMFCTSQKYNELFNQLVYWYPPIKGAKPLELVAEFEPHPVGAGSRVMSFEINMPQVSLWFRQEFPRYLSGEVNYEDFAEGLEKMWLTRGKEDFVLLDKTYQRMLVRSRYNIAVEQSKMLFDEAGDVNVGGLVGSCSPYQLSVEVLNVMQHSIDARRYTWYHLQRGNYQFP